MIVSLRPPDDAIITIYDPEVILVFNSENTLDGDKLLDVYFSKNGKPIMYRNICDLEVF